jgi:hypothetical protein
LPLCPGGGDKNKYKTISIYVQIKVIIIAKTNSNSSAICKSRETGRQTERTFLRLARRGGGGGKKCAQAPLKRDKYCCEIESIWYTLTKNSEANQNKKARAKNTYCCRLIIYSRENCDINCCRNDISLCRLKGEKQRATFCIGRQTERTFLRLARRGGGGGKKRAQAPLKCDKYCNEIESIWYTLTKNSEAHQNKKARAEKRYCCQLIIYSRKNCDIKCCRNDISLCRLKGEKQRATFCIGRQIERSFLRPVRRGGGGKKYAQTTLKHDKCCFEIQSLRYTPKKTSPAHLKKARADSTYCCQLIIYIRKNCDFNCCRNYISLCMLKGEKQRKASSPSSNERRGRKMNSF